MAERVAPKAGAPGSIDELQARLRRFADARDWGQFHNAKNLVMALVAEAGELVEHFQWLTAAQSADLAPEKLAQVRLEMADVFIYLARLADVLGVDLLAAAGDKVALNEKRYPAEQVRGHAWKYDDDR
jgi:dCTP diphosphatase